MISTDFIKKSFFAPNQAALITSPVNRRYLTGFKSSYGFVVITREQDYLFVDGRYYEKASDFMERAMSPFKVMLIDEGNGRGIKQLLGHVIKKYSIKVMAIESHTTTIGELEHLKQTLPQVEIDSSEHLSELIEKKRMIKTPGEIERITSAQRIAERAFAKITRKMRVGITERQIAAMLDYYLVEEGGHSPSFETIVASGPNSAIPHATPTNRAFKDGDFVVVDFGATVDGYHSDMTRTVAIGQPSDEMKRVYNAVWSANTDALKTLRPNITGKVPDNAAKTTLETWGYSKYFTHSLGHGVGLEVHEKPAVSATSKTNFSLKENMIITIEPGVYIPGRFGVRIEDMALITADGCINLAKTEKSIICI